MIYLKWTYRLFENIIGVNISRSYHALWFGIDRTILTCLAKIYDPRSALFLMDGCIRTQLPKCRKVTYRIVLQTAFRGYLNEKL